MLEALNGIVPIYLLILVGFILGKTKVAGAEWEKAFNNFSLKLGFPVLIFYSVYSSGIRLEEAGQLFLINSAYILSCFMIAVLLGKVFSFDQKMMNTIFICLPFGNIAFLGIPIIKSFYGSSSVGETAVISGIYLFWIFTIGIAYLEKSKGGGMSFWLILRNPFIIAIIASLSCVYLDVKLPFLLEKPLMLISSAVTPIVLIALGLFISALSLKRALEDIGMAFQFVILAMICLPLIYLWVINLFGIDSKLSIMEAAMPLAVTPFTLADKYEMDKRKIAVTIALSTFVAAFSLSVLKTLL